MWEDCFGRRSMKLGYLWLECSADSVSSRSPGSVPGLSLETLVILVVDKRWHPSWIREVRPKSRFSWQRLACVLQS